MQRTAIIFGVTGQDGLLLAHLLLKKEYVVIGFGRSASILRNENLASLRGKIQLFIGDVTDSQSVKAALDQYPVSEIYNFAAQSRPGESWRLALETGDVNAMAAHRLFDLALRLRPDARIYQASSSEMFGLVRQSPQNEKTPFNPINPYAVAKTYAHNMARIYRETYGSYISCGILFNHESRYRRRDFLCQKVTYGAACAKLGIINSPDKNERDEPLVREGKLALGNLTAERDWGFAGDYVEAIWLMLQQSTPEDYVIGTGRKRSVAEMCEVAYRIVDVDWRDHVISDARFLRPLETGSTVADASKARDALGWTPKTSFEDMLKDMVVAHIERLSAPLSK